MGGQQGQMRPDQIENRFLHPAHHHQMSHKSLRIPCIQQEGNTADQALAGIISRCTTTHRDLQGQRYTWMTWHLLLRTPAISETTQMLGDSTCNGMNSTRSQDGTCRGGGGRTLALAEERQPLALARREPWQGPGDCVCFSLHLSQCIYHQVHMFVASKRHELAYTSKPP